MKKILAVVSDGAHVVLMEYKNSKGLANIDTALDELLLEREKKADE